MSLRALRHAFLALALISTGACGTSGSSSSGSTASDAMTPLPAPAGLLADVFVPAPSATWTKLRSSVGGPAVLMPQSFGGLVTVLAGLPITVSAEIDEDVPVVGAATRQDKGTPAAVIGIHVKSGERIIGQLTRGEGARFNVTVNPKSRVSRLADKVSPDGARFAIGVLGNYLLIATTAADLDAIGPYVVRTLPTRAMPKEEVALELDEAALAGPIAEAAREMRGRSEGAAAALIPVGSMLDGLIGLCGDATHARVTLAFDPRNVHARATITPKPGNGPGAKLLADLPIGDVKPMLDLPSNTTLGVLWRESKTARGESAPKQAEALAKLFGKDVPATDRDAIASALRSEADARGDWQAVGIAFNGTGPTAVVRAPVTEPDKMKKALKQLVDLGELSSFKKALAGLGLSLTTDKAVVENVAGDVVRVQLARVDEKDTRASETKGAKAKDKGKAKDDKAKDDKAKAAPAPGSPDLPKAIDLLYLVNGEGLFAAAGFDPKDALRALARAPSGGNLASVAPMAAALEGVSDATFVLLADALRINAMTSGAPSGPPMPALIAAGRSASSAELWARADVPFSVLQEAFVEFTRRRVAPPAPPPMPAGK